MGQLHDFCRFVLVPLGGLVGVGLAHGLEFGVVGRGLGNTVDGGRQFGQLGKPGRGLGTVLDALLAAEHLADQLKDVEPARPVGLALKQFLDRLGPQVVVENPDSGKLGRLTRFPIQERFDRELGSSGRLRRERVDAVGSEEEHGTDQVSGVEADGPEGRDSERGPGSLGKHFADLLDELGIVGRYGLLLGELVIHPGRDVGVGVQVGELAGVCFLGRGRDLAEVLDVRQVPVLLGFHEPCRNVDVRRDLDIPGGGLALRPPVVDEHGEVLVVVRFLDQLAVRSPLLPGHHRTGREPGAGEVPGEDGRRGEHPDVEAGAGQQFDRVRHFFQHMPEGFRHGHLLEEPGEVGPEVAAVVRQGLRTVAQEVVLKKDPAEVLFRGFGERDVPGFGLPDGLASFCFLLDDLGGAVLDDRLHQLVLGTLADVGHRRIGHDGQRVPVLVVNAIDAGQVDAFLGAEHHSERGRVRLVLLHDPGDVVDPLAHCLQVGRGLRCGSLEFGKGLVDAALLDPGGLDVGCRRQALLQRVGLGDCGCLFGRVFDLAGLGHRGGELLGDVRVLLGRRGGGRVSGSSSQDLGVGLLCLDRGVELLPAGEDEPLVRDERRLALVRDGGEAAVSGPGHEQLAPHIPRLVRSGEVFDRLGEDLPDRCVGIGVGVRLRGEGRARIPVRISRVERLGAERRVASEDRAVLAGQAGDRDAVDVVLLRACDVPPEGHERVLEVAHETGHEARVVRVERDGRLSRRPVGRKLQLHPEVLLDEGFVGDGSGFQVRVEAGERVRAVVVPAGHLVDLVCGHAARHFGDVGVREGREGREVGDLVLDDLGHDGPGVGWRQASDDSGESLFVDRDDARL